MHFYSTFGPDLDYHRILTGLHMKVSIIASGCSHYSTVYSSAYSSSKQIKKHLCPQVYSHGKPFCFLHTCPATCFEIKINVRVFIDKRKGYHLVSHTIFSHIFLRLDILILMFICLLEDSSQFHVSYLLLPDSNHVKYGTVHVRP